MPAFRLEVRVSPGAQRSEVIGRYGERWRIRLAAAPERGRANEALLDLLAATLEVPRGQLKVVAGAASRDKVIQVQGMTGDEAARLLERRGRKGTA